MNIAEYRKLLKKKPKYRNFNPVMDGIKFDSQKEMNRYSQLKFLEKHNKIQNLQRQVKFQIVVSGFKICTFVADFTYEIDGQKITEDVKSPMTRKLPVYRIKKKLLKAFGVEILET